jgi:hypothetical protein
MPLFKENRLGRWLLFGGLVLVLAQGLVRTPEVGSRFFPQLFWDEQLNRARENLIVAEMGVDELVATEEALQREAELGFPGVDATPNPSQQGLSRAWERVKSEERQIRDKASSLEVLLKRLQRLKEEMAEGKTGSRRLRHLRRFCSRGQP